MSDENIIPEGGFDSDDMKDAVSNSTPEPSVPEPTTHHDEPVGNSAEERVEQDARDAEQAQKKGIGQVLNPGSLGSVSKKMNQEATKDRLAQDEADIKHDKVRGVNEEYGRHGTQAEIEAGLSKTGKDSEEAAKIAALIAATVVTGGGAGAAAAGAEGAAAGGTAAAGTAAAEGAAATGAGAGAGAAAAEGTAAASGSAEAAAAASRAGASAASSSSAEAAAGAGARTAASEGAASSQGARAASQASQNAAKSSGAVSEEAVANAAKETGEQAASKSASKVAESGKAPGQTISTDAAAERAGTRSAQESAKKVTNDSVAQRKKIVEEAKKKAKEEGKKQAKKHAREIADGTKKKKSQAKKDRKNSRYDQQAQAEQNLSIRRSAKYGGATGAAAAAGTVGAGAGAAGDSGEGSMSGQSGDQTVAITSDSRWDKKKTKQATEQSQADKLAQNRAAEGKKNKALSDKESRKDLLKQEAKTRNEDKSGPDHRGRYEKKMDKKQEKTGRNPANIPVVGGISRGRMAVDRKVKSMMSTAAVAAGMSLFMILTMITTVTTTTTGSNQNAQNSQQNGATSAFIGMSICTPDGTTGGDNGGGNVGDVGPIDPTVEAHAKAVYKVLSGMGMPDKNIAGILGNWTQESGVDPTSVQGIFSEPYKIGPRKKAKLKSSGNNYGIGLGQWTASRNTRLINYAKKHNEDWYDLSLQMKFMNDMNGDDPINVKVFHKMIDEELESPTEAAIYFEKKWEIAGKPNAAARNAAAEKWYKKMDSWEEGTGDETDSDDSSSDDEDTADQPDDSGSDSGEGEDTDSGEETTGEAPHWTMPMKDEDYSTSSGYGPRPSPTPGASSWHKGADFAAGDGKPIFAAGDGKVIKAGAASGFGNWVVIDHEYEGKTYSTVYGHMRNNTIKVKTGDKVNAGQQIASVGSEGFSTGPHLHFEIWDGGRFGGGNHTNPVKFLNNVGATDDATGAEGPDGPGNDGGDSDEGGSTGNCSNGLLDWIFGGGDNNGGGDDKGKGDEDTAPGTTDLQNKAIEAGKTQLGIPYSWGGGDLDGPSRGFGRGANTVGFDCSSYVRYAYYQASGGDVTMPRTASLQQKWSGMKDIKRDDLQPGDLIFFGNPATHVAMYVGNGKIMHAPSTGDVIKIAKFDGVSYWEGKDKTFRRVTN